MSSLNHKDEESALSPQPLVLPVASEKQVRSFSLSSQSDGQHAPPCRLPSSLPDPTFSFRQTRGEALAARPSFLTFQSPEFLSWESWDDTEGFYDNELAVGDKLQEQIEASIAVPLALDARTTWRLQKNFLQSLPHWIPLLDLRSCVALVQEAQAGGFAANNASNCFAMFVFAIGAIFEDKDLERSPEQLPGLEYLCRGSQILERFALQISNLEILQCRILQA